MQAALAEMFSDDEYSANGVAFDESDGASRVASHGWHGQRRGDEWPNVSTAGPSVDAVPLPPPPRRLPRRPLRRSIRRASSKFTMAPMTPPGDASPRNEVTRPGRLSGKRTRENRDSIGASARADAMMISAAETLDRSGKQKKHVLMAHGQTKKTRLQANGL